MDEQNPEQPWYKPWRRSKQKAASTGQPSTLLSPSSSKPSRPRSPLGRFFGSATPSNLSPTLPAVPSAASTPPPLQADPGGRGDEANVGNIAPSKPEPSPWEKAVEIANKLLLEHGLTLPCNTSGQPARSIIESTVGDLQNAIGDANIGDMDQKKRNKAAAIKRLQDILKTLDKYAKIVDTAVQHSPEITALIWAGLRATLQVALNHIETMESLEVAIAIIAEKMVVCKSFASVYEETRHSATVTGCLQQTLDLALPEFYAAVLVFTAKAHQYFDPSTPKTTKLGYLLKPFAIEFKPFIDEISKKEKRARECAYMATMNTIKKTSGKLVQMDTLLHGLQSELAPLAKLDVMMDIITKSSNMVKPLDGQEEQKVKKLLAMLTSLESPKRHQDVKSDRVDGTGTWLLQDERFILWRDSFSRDRAGHILCCYGDPGAGKTVISSIVIDNLASEFPQPDSVGIAYIYCDYRDQASQTLVNMLGSLLRQFLSATSTIPKEVIEILERTQKQGKKVEIQDVLHMLNLTLDKFHCCFICIDALDELEPEIRLSLLNACKEFSTVRIFLTGRPIVQEHVNSRLGSQQQDAINITAHPSDILSYLNHRIMIDRDINPEIMNDELKDEILNTIMTKSKGMFLLPKLHIRMILENRTIAKRRSALEMLPEDLNNAFTAMVDRILKSRTYKDLGSRTLVLLHLAYRPLKLEELRHALSVEPGQNELDKDNIPLRETFLDCCLGLVIVDEETMTVRFVHYTLEEHFKVHGSTYFPNRYTTIAKICLTYLNFSGLMQHCTTSDNLEEQMARYPFLEYVAQHWGYYSKQQDDDFVMQLALNLLRQESMPSCSIQAIYKHMISKYSLYSWRYTHTVKLSGLHLAAYFGLEGYMVELIGSVHFWDAKEEFQRTPLSIAASNGNDGMVKLLLGQDNVDVNSKDEDGRSPLSYAASNGQEAIVRLLLKRDDVDTDSKDKDSRSPLSYAAGKGYEAIVRLLLERDDVDVNSKDEYGRSPLSYAAWNGQEAIVRLLLERDNVDADSKAKGGRSPLSYAAEREHEAVVRLLLERDNVDADSKDEDGRSPLSYAAGNWNGQEAIMGLLLERDNVDINSKDKDGRSPLSYAAKREHEAIVRLLLERDDVDADSKDKDGRSVLSYAAEKGHEAIVKLLLERDNVDADSKDNYGRSPLSYAASKGHEAIVRLFLERDNVDTDSKDNYGRSPLSYAASKGHEAIVRLFLKRDNVDADSKNKDGRSPLFYAAGKGHEAIVRLLLARDDVDADSKDEDGSSLLFFAAMGGNEAIVRLLLERDNVDADLKNKHGSSPLSYAVMTGHEAIVRLLLARDDVDADSKDEDGNSPLSYAAMTGHEAIVRLLLARDDVDADSKDEDGSSLLFFAAMGGNEAIVRLLLEQDDVDADSKDEYGRSPLSYAAEEGHEAIVRLLLERDNVDADLKDGYGRSPLSYAAEQGNEAIVRLLLERDDVNADSKDKDSRSPLSYATLRRDEDIVRQDDVDTDSSSDWSLSSTSNEEGRQRVAELLQQHLAQLESRKGKEVIQP